MLQLQTNFNNSDKRKKTRSSSANYRVVVDGVVRLGDLLVVAASGLVASRLRFAETGHPAIVTVALLIGILLAANVFSLLRLYDHEHIPQLGHQLPRLLAGWAVTIGGVLAVLYGLKIASDLSRLWLGYWFVTGCCGFVVWRSAVRLAVQDAQGRSRLRRNVVLVGGSDLMADCIDRLGRHAHVVGVLLLDDRAPATRVDCRCGSMG